MNTKLLIGIHRRLFNKSLKDAMSAASVGNEAVGVALGIHSGTVSRIINFKYNPSEEQKLKIAITLNVTEDEIFPEKYDEIYNRVSPLERDVHVEVDTLQLDTPAMLQLKDPNATEDVVNCVENGLLRDVVLEIINQLRPRERDILTMRFGLGEQSPVSLDEVAVAFNITRERVGQIEAYALEKVRLHDKARVLTEFATR